MIANESLFSLLPVATQTLDPATQSQGFFVLGGIVALAVMANQVMSAVANWKKLKGIDPGSEDRYASKGEIEVVKKDVSTLRGEVKGLSTTLSNELRAIHRSLGRIEGKIGTDPDLGTPR